MADGILTAAVSVTSAVGGIGESLTVSVFATLLNYPHSRRQALSLERRGSYLYRTHLFPYIAVHLSPLAGLLTCPLPRTTAWYLSSIVRLRAQYVPQHSFSCFTPHTELDSHLCMAPSSRRDRHIQHRTVSWHFSRVRSLAGCHV
jgi:hypothetical protein